MPERFVTYKTEDQEAGLVPVDKHGVMKNTKLATETFVKEEIAKAQLPEGEVDLSVYATKDYVNESVPKSTSELNNDSGYITSSGVMQIVNGALEGYATKEPAANLLDNGYFVNPVNQRGFISGTIGAGNLSIDRWYLQHGTALHLLDGCIGLSGFWDCWQVVGTDLRAGETYTFAVLAKGETGNETLMLSIGTTDASLSEMHFYNIGTDWQIYAITCTPSKNMEIGTVHVKMGVNTGNEQSTKTLIKWAAFYEGEYTAETLPPYVPKGYADELLACSIAETGRVHDSDKLGGKSPSYYLTAVNLLDNSNFKNPVNQRGQTSYTEEGYTIDRWETWIESGIANVSLMEGYISINFGGHGAFYQKLAKGVIDLSKQYSLVIKQRGISPIISYPTAVLSNADNDLITLADLRDGNTMEIEWCALYEGEYTAETLPPYVPKGYAVELAECRRYYRKQPDQPLPGVCFYANSLTVIGLDRSPMRKIPSLTIDKIASVDQSVTYTPSNLVADGCGLVWIGVNESISVGQYAYVWGIEENADL